MISPEKFELLCNNHLPNIGKEIGYGSQGRVYSIANVPDKVIKLAVLDTGFDDPIRTQSNIKDDFLQVMALLKNNSYSCFPKIYDYGVFTIPQDFAYHYYGYSYACYSVMERLIEIPKREQDFFDYIANYVNGRDSNVDAFSNFLISYMKNNDYYFDTEKILSLFINLINVPIDHNDLAGFNFMRDKDYNYKVIDLERATVNNNF